MVARTTATIDDNVTTDLNGSAKPESRESEPARDPSERITPFETVSPFDIDGGTGIGDGSPQPKRRGRPPGSRNKSTTEKEAPKNLVEGLSDLLLSVHMMGAVFFKCEEIELTEEESKRLADKIKKVSTFYPMVFDPKKLAIADLATTLVSIYGPRGVAIYKRASKPIEQPKPQLVPPRPQSQQAQVQSTPLPRPKIEVPSQLFEAGVTDVSVI